MNEYWDILNAFQEKTGETIQRGEPLKEGQYHRVVHVCIFNERGELLIQKRTSSKDLWPGIWDVSVGGSALQGETSPQAATRETKEELGLSVELDQPIITIHGPDYFDDWYVITKDVELPKLHLQQEEVEMVCWASLEEVQEKVNHKEFVPFPNTFLAWLFEQKEKHGLVD